MTALVMILMLVAFVLLDVGVRALTRRAAATRERRAREQVLNVSLRLEFADEARSLKRVEVANPKARILAVDDEAIILDSFRKILVLDGFSVDTVESGPEALSLVRRNDYDFVFTDLKMPGMDGVEVVKAVHHLRPDVDIAVITGYGTIDTAVETMQHGALEYVQKPFTEDELVAFARRLLIKREARLEAARKPMVRLVAPSAADEASEHEYAVPGGAFVSDGHVWARLEASGDVKCGLDDLARKALGSFEAIALPAAGTEVARGEVLFTVRRGTASVHFRAPASGRVHLVNESLRRDPSLPHESPYQHGWVCVLAPGNIAEELPLLHLGQPLVSWYADEIEKLRHLAGEDGLPLTPARWGEFDRAFAARGAGAAPMAAAG